MTVNSYDAQAVILTIGGLPITGFRDGDKVSVEADGDLWTKQVGVDGAVSRSRQNQPGGKITVGLMYGEAANAILETFKTLDLLTGHAPVTISMFDVNGGVTVFSGTAWLMKQPGVPIARDNGEIEWVFDCADLTIIMGILIPS